MAHELTLEIGAAESPQHSHREALIEELDDSELHWVFCTCPVPASSSEKLAAFSSRSPETGYRDALRFALVRSRVGGRWYEVPSIPDERIDELQEALAMLRRIDLESFPLAPEVCLWLAALSQRLGAPDSEVESLMRGKYADTYQSLDYEAFFGRG